MAGSHYDVGPLLGNPLFQVLDFWNSPISSRPQVWTPSEDGAQCRWWHWAVCAS